MAFCVECGAANAGGRFCGQCGTPVDGGASGPVAAVVDAEPTSFENKCLILADVWLNYRNDEDFTDFVEYNDLGLPLAYAISEGIVDSTETAEGFINETFDLLLAGVGVAEDVGFESMEDIFAQSADDNA